jgi:hypothetical protein
MQAPHSDCRLTIDVVMLRQMKTTPGWGRDIDHAEVEAMEV